MDYLRRQSKKSFFITGQNVHCETMNPSCTNLVLAAYTLAVIIANLYILLVFKATVWTVAAKLFYLVVQLALQDGANEVAQEG